MGKTLSTKDKSFRIERQWETYPLGLPHVVPKAKTILEVVSAVTEVSVEDIQSSRRPAHIVNARRMYHFLTKEMTCLSYPHIGRLVRQDHTTVIHNVTMAEKLLREGDEQFNENINQAKFLLKKLLVEGTDAYDSVLRLRKAAKDELNRAPAGRSSRVNRGNENALAAAASTGRVRLSAAE